MLSFGKRPRELSWFHAGPMLFGDWGTSRLYVLGIAFAASGHGSLFYVGLMGVLLLVVGWAYTVICRAYPDGGGVYAAARERAPVLGVIGGLLLFADYVVTAALSAVEAFHYVGFDNAGVWAVGAIALLGVVHFFGPKKAGVLALWIAAASFAGYLVVAALCFKGFGCAKLEIPSASVSEHWTSFVHIVLALSGVEAVANMTGIMVSPVASTSRKTIWPVAIEVVVLNLILAVGMNGIPVAVEELKAHQNDMVRVLAEHYVGPGFAAVSGVVFALLLLSASSTAITGMLGIQFSMARDGEIPRGIGRLNRFGVPQWALVVSVAAPVLVLAFVHDVDGLAALYAIGVVGAIALNCYATGRSTSPDVGRRDRVLLLLIAALMLAIWITTGVEKPHALVFAGIVLATGLVARYGFRAYRERVHPVEKVPFPSGAPVILVASRGDTWIVDQGYARASEIGAAVVVCLVREASFLIGRGASAQPDRALDPEASNLFEYARKAAQARNIPMRTFYDISTQPMAVVADVAATMGVAELHVGGSRRSRLEKVLRGSPLSDIESLLPEGIELVIHDPKAPTSVRDDS